MSLFKINNLDLTRHILVGSYQVNKLDITTNWQDSTGISHRSMQKSDGRISGSMNIHFRDAETLEAFQEIIRTGKAPDGTFLMFAYANNTGEELEFFGYATLTPSHTIRASKGNLANFTLTIEEKKRC